MPESRQFTSPHGHPQSLDSASTPAAFVKRAVELGAPAMTCTDHGSLAAVHQVYALANKAGIWACPGIEAYVRDDDCPIMAKNGIQKRVYSTSGCPAHVTTDPKCRKCREEARMAERYPEGTYLEHLKYMHLTLGFRDYQAYLCGVRLLSRADARAEQHGSEKKPLFGWPEIEELASYNTTAGSSCLIGMVSRHLVGHRDVRTAKAYFERLHHLFGDRYYVEAFPHVCDRYWDQGVYVQFGDGDTVKYHLGKRLMTDIGEVTAEELSSEFGKVGHKRLLAVKNYQTWEDMDAEIVAVRHQQGYLMNECSAYAPDGDLQAACNGFVLRMAEKHKIPILVSDDFHLATVEDKIVQDVRLAQSGSWKFSDAYEMKSSAQAWDYFSNRLGISEVDFERWVDNSWAWAEGFKGFKFDTTPKLPTKFYPQDSLKHTKELLQRHGRLPTTAEEVQRLRQELDLLHRNGKLDLLPYFHCLEEVNRLYANQGQLTGPGRGSAAGLSMSYRLGITHVEPLRYGLSVDRFLTKDRVQSGTLPDIDQDLGSRDLLVGYPTDVVEFEAGDGTKHVVPEDMVLETDKGLLTIREVVEQGADLREWW